MTSTHQAPLFQLQPLVRLSRVALLLAIMCSVTGLAGQRPTAPNRSLLAPLAGSARDTGGHAAGIARARVAVAHVFVEVDGRNTFRIERPGSGVLIHESGLVLTWYDLVAEAQDAGDKSIQVQWPGQQSVSAELLATDDATGLALLKVDLVGEQGAAALPLAGPERVMAGTPVAVLGFHDGSDHHAFAGVTSPAQAAVTAPTAADGVRELRREDLLLTSAAIQDRSHGAVLVDQGGRFVGLCNASRVDEPEGEPTLEQLRAPSFGFVVPHDVVRRAFAEQLALPNLPAGPRVPAPWALATAKAAPSVVAVHRGPRPAVLGVDDPNARRRHEGSGSGVVLSASGLVVTNAHLVAGSGAGEVRVTTLAGDTWPARIVTVAARPNLALLQVELPSGRQLDPIEGARSDDLATGAPLLALGNPQGDAVSVAAGVLSAQRGAWLQTDARLGNENAGGAMIDAAGRFVGLVDGGREDKLEVAWRQRGDAMKVEGGLHRTPGLVALRELLKEDLAALQTEPSGLLRLQAPAGGAVADIVAAVADAMLNIYIEAVVRGAVVDDNPFAPPQQSTRIVSLGSGVVIDPSGLALTNWHVVDSATFPDGSPREDFVVRARRFDGTVHDVEVLSISREEDLALIRLDRPDDAALPAVELGDSERLRVGDSAIAIGNPHGQANTVTAGVITAKGQSIRVKGRWAKLGHLLETDAAINSGNSGGALLDGAGRLIGINSAGGSSFNVTGYAISVDHVRERLRNLLVGPHKTRSVWIGAQLVDDDAGGVSVFDIEPLSPAQRAGLQKRDRIVALDGEPVRWTIGYAMQRLALEPGVAVELVVERGGARQTIEVHPLPRPVWMVQRQIGIEVDALRYRDETQRVRDAVTGFVRAYTGDVQAEPRRLPRELVRVVSVHPTHGDEPVLQVGDLILGVQLGRRIEAGAVAEILRFETAQDLVDCVQRHGSYEGAKLQTWIARGDQVLLVEVLAKKLLP